MEESERVDNDDLIEQPLSEKGNKVSMSGNEKITESVTKEIPRGDSTQILMEINNKENISPQFLVEVGPKLCEPNELGVKDGPIEKKRGKGPRL